MWRQVRGPAGAVMCETRDLEIEWPHWHTLIFEGDRRIDVRYVCPKDVKKMLVQQARSVYWKKWAAKHACEELKEVFGWSRLWPCCARKQKKTCQKSIEMWPENWFWKEVGCRRSFSTLVGRMKVNAKLVTKRKVQKSTGSTIAQNGTRTEGRSQRPSVSGSTKRELQKRSGSGKEVLSRILAVKANGTGVMSA